MAGPRGMLSVMILASLHCWCSQAFAFSSSRRWRHRRTRDLRTTTTVQRTPPSCAFDPTTLLPLDLPAVAPLWSGSAILDNVDPTNAALPILVAASLFAATRAPSRLVRTSVLDSIVAGTYLERRSDPLRRVYKASRDGWSAIAFHEAVDGLGSGVVVARSVTGATFGGYNPNGWRSTDDYYSSSAAFLWCLKGGKVVRLPILVGGNCAVFDYATSGPCFGAADLVIGPPRNAVMGGFAGPDAEDVRPSAGSLRVCTSAVGSAYDYHPAWPARGGVRLVEVEVYCASA